MFCRKMKITDFISECTAYDFKLMLEEKRPKSWLKSVSAFANGLGGSLFFGVDNDGTIKGIDDIQHVCETISSKIRDYLDPLPEVEMIPHKTDEGLNVLQLKVNSGSYTPYYYVGDGQRVAFSRIGDESLPATAEYMVRLVLKGSNKTYDSLITDFRQENNTFIITGMKKMHIPATILFNSLVLAVFIDLSSLEITAFPKSMLPNTIIAIGINIFKMNNNLPINNHTLAVL